MGPPSNEAEALKGKTAIVTGSNIGLGRETALALAQRGASVVMACRNIDRAMEAAAYIREVQPDAKVEPMPLDLKSPASIRQFVSTFRSSHKKLDILVNNAGASFGWNSKLQENGACLCAQVNFVGPYALTRLLKKELVAAAPSRVVNVSSSLHRVGAFTDVETYMRVGGYPQSKLANVMFSNEIQRRWEGDGVESAAVDPGAAYSAIWRNSLVSRPPLSWFFKAAFAPPSDGAVAIVHAACAPWGPTRIHDGRARFFARGMFASYAVTSVAPRQAWLQWPLTLLASVTDWPLRQLTGRLKAVKEVPTNPVALDSALCLALWDAAEKASGLTDKD